MSRGSGRLRHCLAGPHVDLRQGGAVHRCPLCSRAQAHEQGGRSEHRRRSPTKSGQGRVVLISYAGGGIATSSPTSRSRTLPISRGLGARAGRADLSNVCGRRQSPTVIAYNKVYNAIQNGVISAENEAASVEAIKFYSSTPPQPDAARGIDQRSASR